MQVQAGTSKPVVLIPAHFTEELSALSIELDVALSPYDENGTPLRATHDAAAIFRWWIPSENCDRLLAENLHLRWMHTGSAGVDHILTPRFRASAITLTNSAGVHAASIAEWVVAAILSHVKDLPAMRRQQQQRIFEKVQREELQGKRLVLLGAGHIASEIASRFRPFGLHITAVRRTQTESPLFDEVVSLPALHEVVSLADFVVVTLPLSDETRGLIDSVAIEAMSPHALLVNVARGDILDEQALVRALEQGKIAGAILDVFQEEPLPQEHAFWSLENVTILPHTTWRSPQVRAKQIALFSENLRRFCKGELLLNVIDLNREN